MGVPKFYRWISERYPCLSQVVQENQIPDFDNLYLDMNGIIHNCSHPDDGNAHFRISEAQIFAGISHYIETLFRMIKPQKVFFMAVDGVAPRAKMNQQRARRFRSAKDAEMLELKAREKGEKLPEEARFDSNCITPGTEFMARLQTQLEYFVVHKISSDRLWQGVKVYLSGHLVPGEGEHKIMEFIRRQKSTPDYDPNTRHCLYGLDADLIMLGLTSHEPHFALLREEVKFGARQSQKRVTAVEETTFHLLHLSLLRDYLDHEFSAVRTTLTFPYDLEKILDDWVLMGFLVGNDFIPHLPHLHIQHDALPKIWGAYMDIMPKLDGYLNDGGTLNLRRFQAFLQELSKLDFNKFNDEHEDLKWLEGKKGSSSGTRMRGGRPPAGNMSSSVLPHLPDSAIVAVSDVEVPDELPDTLDDTSSDELTDSPASCDEILTPEQLKDFKTVKRSYYKDKMDYTMTPEMLADQATCYVTGIQWILYYYYEGVPSWSWFYPHHYAPYLSDVRGFADRAITFELSEPFLPYQQLMAVLPAASSMLLPECYRWLMADSMSPLINYYPKDFKTDLNGKQQEWEAVVLIPFIDEEKLLSAMKPYDSRLSDSERKRNSQWNCRLYEFTVTNQGPYKSPMLENFPDIQFNHTTYREVTKDELAVSHGQLLKGLCKGVRLDVGFAGFPTLKLVKHKAYLKKANVKVFQAASRNDSMILELAPEDLELDKSLASELLSKGSIWVGWPHLFEARVIAVASDQVKFSVREADKGNVSPASILEEALKGESVDQWTRDMNVISDRYKTRLGIRIGNTSVLLYAVPLCGERYAFSENGQAQLQKQWASEPLPFALQTAVADSAMCRLSAIKPCNTFAEVFPVGARVFGLAPSCYGCSGEVVQPVTPDGKRVAVSFARVDNAEEVSLTALRQQKLKDLKPGTRSSDYQEAGRIAQSLGITGQLLSRITGTVYVQCADEGGMDPRQNRIDIGLDLKRNKTGEECPGYTMKVDDVWYYSSRVTDVIRDYTVKFPHLFERLSKKMNEDNFRARDIFDDSCCSRSKVLEYVRSLPTRNVQRLPYGSAVVDSDTVRAIEQLIDKLPKASTAKRVKIQVLPNQLFLDHGHSHAKVAPDPEATFELFDRVVHVLEGYTVPSGLRGTIIGIVQQQQQAFDDGGEPPVLYEVVFDEQFAGGMTIRSSISRAYRVRQEALINITFGMRKMSRDPKKPPAATFTTTRSPSAATTAAATNSSSPRSQPFVRHEDLWNNMASSRNSTSARASKPRELSAPTKGVTQILRPGSTTVPQSLGTVEESTGTRHARDEGSAVCGGNSGSGSSGGSSSTRRAVSSRLIFSSKARQQQQAGLVTTSTATAATGTGRGARPKDSPQPRQPSHAPVPSSAHFEPPLATTDAVNGSAASEFDSLLVALTKEMAITDTTDAGAAGVAQQGKGDQPAVVEAGTVHKKITVEELFSSVSSVSATQSLPRSSRVQTVPGQDSLSQPNNASSPALATGLPRPTLENTRPAEDSSMLPQRPQQQKSRTVPPASHDSAAQAVSDHFQSSQDASGLLPRPTVTARSSPAAAATAGSDKASLTGPVAAAALEAPAAVRSSAMAVASASADWLSNPHVAPPGSRMRELTDALQASGYLPPFVELGWLNENQIVAHVVLPSGVRISGTVSDSVEAAAESAAAATLLHLRKQQQAAAWPQQPPVGPQMHHASFAPRFPGPAGIYGMHQPVGGHPFSHLATGRAGYGATALPTMAVHGGNLPSGSLSGIGLPRLITPMHYGNIVWPGGPMHPVHMVPPPQPFVPLQVTRQQVLANAASDQRPPATLPFGGPATTSAVAVGAVPTPDVTTMASSATPSSNRDMNQPNNEHSSARAPRLAARFSRK